MKLHGSILLLLIGVILVSVTGCNAPVTPQPQPTLDVAAIKQEIYSTLVAQLTADAPAATNTAIATATAIDTPTMIPTVPTMTAPAAATIAPLSTFTANPSGVTVYPTWTKTPYTDKVVLSMQNPGDGTVMAPGQDFDVKWTFRNSGFRKWNDFYITYWGGLESRTFKTLMMPALNVGEEYTVVADFRAPSEPGNYVSYWRFYNDDKVVLMKFNFAFSVK